MTELERAQRVLEEAHAILETKGQDYAAEGDFFGNFEFTGMLLDHAIEQGMQGADLAFLALLATKLERVIVLRTSGRAPNHEALRDTFRDSAGYNALWASYCETQK